MADGRQFLSDALPRRNAGAELTDMTTCIVIDGLPIAPAAAVSKLFRVVNKLLSDRAVAPKNIDLAQDDDTGASLGFAFLEYPSREEADRAITILNDIPIDRTHRIKANAWADFDTYLSAPDEYVEPTVESVAEAVEIDNPYAWLQDKMGREQYLMKSGASYDVEIFWNDPHMSVRREVIVGPSKPDSDVQPTAAPPADWTVQDSTRRRVQKDYPCWSPMGTYVVSMEATGAKLWATVKGQWTCMVRFDHPKIQKFAMSPRERYAFTACSTKCSLWDVRLGKLVRTFAMGADDKSWPMFKWNHDETLFAQQRKDAILIFNAETLAMVPIALEKDANIDFAWSPATNHLAYSCVQGADKPMRVVLEEFRSESEHKEVAMRNIFGVESVRLVWQPKGTYCASIMTTGQTKPDKIDLFRLGGKEVGIEQLDVTGSVNSLTWDPSGFHGARFCVNSTVKKGSIKNMLSFYHATAGKIRLVATLDDRQTTAVHWSPAGSHAVALDNRGGMEFMAITSDGVNVLQQVEHPGLHNAEWDPSGRYFVTSITVHKTEIDPGFNIYNFLGQRVFMQQVDKFSHLCWRPRPPTPLPSSEVLQILKTLSKRLAKYEKEEEERRSADVEAARRIEREINERYHTTIAAIRAARKAETQDREKLRAKISNGPMFKVEKVMREVVVSVEEQPL